VALPGGSAVIIVVRPDGSEHTLKQLEDEQLAALAARNFDLAAKLGFDIEKAKQQAQPGKSTRVMLPY